ncbi:hypothetical protein O3M35_009837 [Rhynocoris fuscipes]|uniref:Protein YIPF n=1 Tax=Rhynocoris fuscipes TaxID=488301 RepID=A0AAW1D6P0_9HEMI
MTIDPEMLLSQRVLYNENTTATNLEVYNTNYQSKMAFFNEPLRNPIDYSSTSSNYFNQQTYRNSNEYDDEPPLLEELEIYPDKILEKIKLVLDPFKNDVPYDCDLGGPLLFYICLAVSMLLSGGKLNFGYVYGISVIGCIMIYILLRLMTNSDQISIFAVASALGYSLIPIVLLSLLNILFSLNNYFGYLIAFISVIWSSYAASRLLCLTCENYVERPLIMYPCALLYGVFTLLVIF